MKTTPSLTANRLAVALSLVAVFACSTVFLHVQASPEPGAHKAGQKLEGSWTYLLSPILPPGVPPIGPFKAVGAFSRGGAFVGASRDSEFSFGANPQFGVWEHRGGNRYALSFRQDLTDATGAFGAELIGDAQITLADDDSFSGVTNAEMRDADGNLILTLGCATITGERMTIGTLSSGCSAP